MANLFGAKSLMKEPALPMGRGKGPAGLESKGIFAKKKPLGKPSTPPESKGMPSLMKRLTGK